jgi:formamidopyrimidine-DNA glycosylase
VVKEEGRDSIYSKDTDTMHKTQDFGAFILDQNQPIIDTFAGVGNIFYSDETISLKLIRTGLELSNLIITSKFNI